MDSEVSYGETDWSELAGRTALITGASSGIGHAVLKKLIGAGVQAHGTSRTGSGLHAIEDAGGVPHECDVTSSDDRDRLFGELGSIQLFVNSAGANRVGPLAGVSADDWEFVMATNLEGPFFLTQTVASLMPNGGSIVLVSSTAARKAKPETAVYAAAKAGISSLVRSFALDLVERDIRVNGVEPKIIDTPMQTAYVETSAPLEGLTPEQLHAQRVSDVPMRRPGSPEECADVVLFLLSPRSAYMTGQSLSVDGGWLMR